MGHDQDLAGRHAVRRGASNQAVGRWSGGAETTRLRAGRFALALLAVGVAHNMAYRYVDAAHAGLLWNITGAAYNVVLLLCIGLLMRRVVVWLSVAALCGHAAQVIGCSALYWLDPWPIAPGSDLCSDGLAMPLAVLGFTAAALVAGRPGRHGDG